jgi:hypothetical protein
MNRNRLAIAFPIPLFVFSRGIIFFSSKFSGIAVVSSQKIRPKNKNPTARRVLAVGF